MGNECCNEKRKDEDQKQEEVDKHIFDKIGDSFKGVRSLGFKVLEMLFVYFDLERAARNLIPEILLATDILQFCAICRASRKRRHSSTETASMIAKTRMENNFLLLKPICRPILPAPPPGGSRVSQSEELVRRCFCEII